jgi:c-di-GMP-binding flagellar brake protein YcgR
LSDPGSPERRKYKRLNAPVFARPLGGVGAGVGPPEKRSVQDISMGGVRVYTDDKHKKGHRLELELFLPTGDSLTLTAEVVWVDELKSGSPAKFEVGLRYVDVSPDELKVLQGVLRDED